ncbi:putative transmembrane protein [Toxoplasma gondii CAST]|uniref:Putative transmembrane protein n=1 Tax=Toxoplasma gondii CAST TaxID=943122 RepID=A0A425I3S9_TOXGO|nr:putative transmembrane protein [Toxoplasma gondii CAST]
MPARSRQLASSASLEREVSAAEAPVMPVRSILKKPRAADSSGVNPGDLASKAPVGRVVPRLLPKRSPCVSVDARRGLSFAPSLHSFSSSSSFFCENFVEVTAETRRRSTSNPRREPEEQSSLPSCEHPEEIRAPSEVPPTSPSVSVAPTAQSRGQMSPEDSLGRQYYWQSVQTHASEKLETGQASPSLASLEDGRSVGSVLTRKSDRTTASGNDQADDGFPQGSSDAAPDATSTSPAASSGAARVQELREMEPEEARRSSEEGRSGGQGGENRACGLDAGRNIHSKENGSGDAKADLFLGIAPVASLKKKREGEGTEETLPGGENLLTDGEDSSSRSLEPSDKAGDGGGFWSYRWLPATFRKNKRRRRLLFFFLLLLLLLAIGLPILFFLVAPRIVAEQVKAVRVRVRSTTIENPDPSGFLASIDFEFLSSTPVAAHVEDLPVSISWQERPVGRMTVPGFTMQPSTRNIAFSSDFRVTNRPHWDAFLTAMLRDGKSEWRIQGQAKIRVLGLTFSDIPFDKTVEIEGPPLPVVDSARNARGFQVEEMDLAASDENRFRARAKVAFDNTSTSAINSLGELQFLLSYRDTPIGLLRSRGPVLLQRGRNSYWFDAELHPAVVPISREIQKALQVPNSPAEETVAKQRNAEAVGSPAEIEGFYSTDMARMTPSEDDATRFRTALSDMMSASLSGAPVYVKTIGVYTTQPLFAAAVRALAMETPVKNLFGAEETHMRRRDGGVGERTQGGGLVKEMRFDHFDISAEPSAENVARVAAKVTVRFANPLGDKSPLDIQTVSLSASLRRGGLDGTPMGVINGLMHATGPPRPVENPQISLNSENNSFAPSSSLEPAAAPLASRTEVAAFEREEKLVNFPEAASQPSRDDAGAFLAPLAKRLPAEAKPEGDGDEAPSRRLAVSRDNKPVLVNMSVMDVSFDMEGTIELADEGVPFSAFIRDMVSEPAPFVALAFTESDVEIQTVTALGPLVLKNLPLDQTLTIASMGDMRNVKIESFEVTGEVPGAWLISTVVAFPSKAPTSVYLGNLGLNLRFRDVLIGSVVARNVYIAQGTNKLRFTGRLQPPADALDTISEFFSAAVASPPRGDSRAGQTAENPSSMPGDAAFAVEEAAGEQVPMMQVTITAAAARLLDALEEEKADQDGGENGELSRVSQKRQPMKWVQEGVEGVSMDVPVPQVGTTADLVRSVNMKGLRMSLDGETATHSLDEAVPLRGSVELFLNNPLGRHLALRLSAVSLTFALAVDLPTEAAVVPTPSGLSRPVVSEVPEGAEDSAGVDSVTQRFSVQPKTRRLVVGRLATQVKNLQSEAVGHLFSDSATPPSTSSEGDASVLRLVLPLAVPLELAGDGAAFAEFVNAFLESENVELLVFGEAECTVQTGFGDVKIRNVDVKSALPLQGLHALKGSRLTAFKIVGYGSLRSFLDGNAHSSPDAESAGNRPNLPPSIPRPDASQRRTQGKTHNRETSGETGEETHGEGEVGQEERRQRLGVSRETGEKALLLDLTALMRNPSEATVDMGSIELDILHMGATVGRVKGANVSLVPGDNFLNFVGGILLSRSTEAAVSSLVTRALLNADLELRIAVSAAARKKGPEWLTLALRGATILPEIPPLAELLPSMDRQHLLQDVSFDALTVSAVGWSPKAPASLLFQAATTVVALNPLGSAVPVSVRSVSFSATVSDRQGRRLGHLALPETPATSIGSGSEASLKVSVNVEDGRLLLDAEGVQLGRAIQEFLETPAVSLGLVLQGRADVRVDVGEATLVIGGLQIEKAISLGGAERPDANRHDAEESSVPASPNEGNMFSPRLLSFSFDGAHPTGGVSLAAVASMKNPAPVRLVLPRLFFSISFNETLLGHVWLADDMVVVEPSPRETQLRVRGRLYRQTTESGLHDLNALVKAVVSRVTLGENLDTREEAIESGRRSPVSVKIKVDRSLETAGLVTQPSHETLTDAAGSGNAPAGTLPLWLAVGLDGLALEAPVDGEQVLPRDLLRQLELKTVLVRLQPGANAPLLLDSRLQLHLQNPFGPGASLEIENVSVNADLRDAQRNRVFGRLSGISSRDVEESEERSAEAASAIETQAFPYALASRLASSHACEPETAGRSSSFDETKDRGSQSSERDLCVVDLPFSGALAVTDATAFADFAVAEATETPFPDAGPAPTSLIRVEGEAGATVHTPLGRLVVDGLAIRQAVPFSGVRALLASLSQGVSMQSFKVSHVAFNQDGVDRILFSARVALGSAPDAENASDATSEGRAGTEAMEVQAGTLKLDLVSGGVVIGSVETREAVLGALDGKPREIAVEGELFEASSVRGSPSSRLLALMRSAVGAGSGDVGLLIQSHRATAANAAVPAWLLDTIDRMQLRPALSGLDSALHLVESLRLQALSIAILDATHLATDAVVSVETRSPLGSDVALRVEEVAADILLFSPAADRGAESGASRGPRMATLRLASRPPSSQAQEGDLLRLELSLSHVNFGDTLELAGDGAVFGEFVAALLNGEAGSTPYEATVHASVSTAFGAFKIEGLKVRAAADLLNLAGAAAQSKRAERRDEAAGAREEGAATTPAGLLDDLSFDLVDLNFRSDGESPRESGVAFDATMALRLPMDVSLSLGSLAFRVDMPLTEHFSKPPTATDARKVSSAFLGSLRIPNLSLQPGVSTIAVSGQLMPRAADLPVVSDFLSHALRGLSPNLLVLGQDVELVGAATPLWLSKAARAMRVWAPLPAKGLEKYVAGSFANLSLQSVGISAVAPAVQSRDDAVALSADVRARLQSPFGDASRLAVKTVRLDVELKRRRDEEERQEKQSAQNGGIEEEPRPSETRESAEEDAASGGSVRRLQARGGSVHAPATNEEDDLETVGWLRMQDVPLEQVGEEIHVHLEHAVLTFEDRGDSFAALALSLMQATASVEVYVRGSASVVVDTELGLLDLRELPLSLEVPVEGLEIFAGRTLQHLSEGALENLRVSDFADPTVKGLHLSTRLVMENSHDVSVDLGPMAFDLTYEGLVIGAVVLPHFAMLPGRNEVELEGAVKPEGLEAFSRLASSFFLEKQYTVGVRGTPTKRLFSASAGDASEAAKLAVAHAGVQGRAPRWLREVLANVEFAVPVSGSLFGDGAGRGRRPEDAVSDMVKKVELVNIDVDFTGPRDPFVSGEVQVFYALPERLDIRHQVETVAGDMSLFHRHDQGPPTPLGSMHLGELAPVSAAQLLEAEAPVTLAAAARDEPVSALVRAQHGDAAETAVGAPVALKFFVDALRLSVLEGAENALSNMIAEIVNKRGEMHILLKGRANLKIHTALGTLDIQDVPINLTKSFKCIGGLDPETVKNAFQMEEFGIQSGKAHGLLASAHLRLMMPKVVENFSVRLGKVTLDMFTPISPAKREQLGDLKLLSPPALKLVQPHPQFGYVIQAGMVQVADMAVPSKRPAIFARQKDSRSAAATDLDFLDSGAEQEDDQEFGGGEGAGEKYAASDGWLIGKAVLLRPVVDVAGEEVAIGTREIMSNYMNGRTGKLVIRGSLDSSENPILAGLFAQMEAVVDLPGTQQKLIKGVQISFRNGAENPVSSFLSQVNDPHSLLQALPEIASPSRLRGLPSLNFFVPVIEAVSVYENPVKVPIKLYYADMETFYEGQSLGGMVIDKGDKPDIIPPMQISHSTPVRIVPKLQNTSAALAIVRNIVSGTRKNVAIDVRTPTT